MPYNSRFVKTLYNKEWLKRVYVDENRNANQVAALLDCSRQAVHAALKRFGLPRKDLCAAQRLADRSTTIFVDTIFNEMWLRERMEAGKSNQKIADEAGCSASSVVKACDHFGIQRTLRERWNVGPKPERKTPYISRPGARRSNTKGAMWSRARHMTPEGPCALCSRPGDDVNHKDGDPTHNVVENLERLCRRHHCQQHAAEVEVAYQLLEEFGVPRIQVYERARKVLLRRLAEDQDKATCPVTHPTTNARCRLPAGHEGKHRTRTRELDKP